MLMIYMLMIYIDDIELSVGALPPTLFYLFSCVPSCLEILFFCK
jgi:hypothetical protein